MTKLRRLLALLTLAALTVGLTGALAKDAEDVTARCQITARKSKFGVYRLTDGQYEVWKSGTHVHPYVEITLPEGESCSGIAIRWGRINPRWEIQVEKEGKWTTYQEGETAYLHTYTPLDGLTHFRIGVSGGAKDQLEITELTVLGEGDKPDWIQDWQPSPDKADLLLLVAHPDDEYVFMGGLIPYYAVAQKKSVLVAYVCETSYERRAELLNGLWAVGLRQYPEIGRYHDPFGYKLKDAYKRVGKAPLKYAVELLRRYKPEVAVSHDIHGEYGHCMHQLTADILMKGLQSAADPGQYPELAKTYGVWDTPKCYLHLYPENPIYMDWTQPMDCFGGKSALEMAKKGFSYHVSQQKTVYRVYSKGDPYDGGAFGLYRSLVGPDTAKNDFFENLK